MDLNTPHNSIQNTPPNHFSKDPDPDTSTNPIPNITPEPIQKEVDDEPLTQKRKPARTSDIWEHFTKVLGGNPLNPRCNCNYCGADYACHSTNGTSSLWAHLRKCKKNPERAVDKKQKLLSFKKETNGASNLLAVTFNKVRCRTALAKFVVKDEQAFRVVEGDGFKELVQELQPMFVVPSRVTIARDVHHLYFRERVKLMEVHHLYLKYCFESIYDAELVARLVMKVESLLQRLYATYAGDGEASKTHESKTTPNVGNETNKRRLLESYLHQQKMDITEKKNDVDRYLADEPINPMTSSFDILIWWKDNSERYKILSIVARDVLAIQVSTVASESAFSTSGRILDPFRSSLSPKMLEALVCTQSWLKGQNGGLLKLDNFVDETHTYQFLEEDIEDKNKMEDQAIKKTRSISIIEVDE